MRRAAAGCPGGRKRAAAARTLAALTETAWLRNAASWYQPRPSLTRVHDGDDGLCRLDGAHHRRHHALVKLGALRGVRGLECSRLGQTRCIEPRCVALQWLGKGPPAARPPDSLGVRRAPPLLRARTCSRMIPGVSNRIIQHPLSDETPTTGAGSRV